MLAKSRRAERGELRESSVVQTPRARLYAGLPNSLLGVLYYLGLAIAIWLVRTRLEAVVLGAIVAFAALTSAVLAYSLLFVTRRQCPYCWTGHAVNWTVAAIYGWLFSSGVLFSPA